LGESACWAMEVVPKQVAKIEAKQTANNVRKNRFMSSLPANGFIATSNAPDCLDPASATNCTPDADRDATDRHEDACVIN